MATKKITELTTATGATTSWYIPLCNPSTGVTYKMTAADFATLIGGGDVIAPTVVSATANTASTIVVVFSENVTATTAGWSFKKNGTAWSISSVTGSGTTWTFTMGTSAVIGDTITRTYDSATGNTVDTASNELVSFTDQSVTNGIGDTTAPTVVSATATTATTVEIVFSETVTVTTAGWSFKKNGSAWAITSVSGSGTTWTFTMGTSAVGGDTLLRSYDSTTGATVDTASNELVSFTDQSVTNNVFDTDAVAFFTAAGITDATQKNAVNTFVLALKSASIWTKMDAIYPFVGGTATTHKFNLVNPADTDGAFRLTFTGSWTHNANGITADGATTYANTHYKHDTNLASKTSFHISLYSRTNTNPSSEYDIDNQSSGQMRIGLLCKLSGSAYSFNGGTITPTVTTSQRLFVNTRQSNVVHKLFQDGTQAGSTDTADITSSTANQYDLYLGASFANGSQSGSTFTNRNYSFMSLGDGLSDADVTALTNAVNTLQTSLSRNV